MRCMWSEAMKPRNVSRFPTILNWLRSVGAGAPPALYVEIVPHIATRPCSRSASIAASRWSPPTLSK